jgi:hypothetical protein
VTNKSATAAASLVAAVPAAALAFFLVQSFLTRLGQLNTMFLGLYGATLAACVGIVFLPFAVLIFGPKAPTRKAAAADSGSKDAPPEKTAETGELPVRDEFDKSTPELDAMEMEEGGTEGGATPTSTGELEIVEPTQSDAELEAFDDFDSGEAETEAFAADEDEFRFDDEEEPPKKKKK